MDYFVLKYFEDIQKIIKVYTRSTTTVLLFLDLYLKKELI